jgi:hypothetical protein
MMYDHNEFRPPLANAREAAYRLGKNSLEFAPNRAPSWVTDDRRGDLLRNWQHGREDARHAV